MARRTSPSLPEGLDLLGENAVVVVVVGDGGERGGVRGERIAAGRPGRSRSKRPTSSAAKCCESAAEPLVAAGERLLSALERRGERFTGARDFGGQRLGHAAAQLDAFLEVFAQVCGEIHRVRFYPNDVECRADPLAGCRHPASPRRSGMEAPDARGRDRRARPRRRGRAWGHRRCRRRRRSSRSLRIRTSTNTRDSPSRATRSISPKRVRKLRATMCDALRGQETAAAISAASAPARSA